MTIEVNEIAIQLKVRDEPGAESEPGSESDGGGLTQQGRDAIVADCVARVLRILKAREER